jgi:hypothetical protein
VPRCCLTIVRGCIGNAGAYGSLVELNEQREGAGVKLKVYSGEHYHQQTIRDREAPGPFYVPPVASSITTCVSEHRFVRKPAASKAHWT